MSASLDNSESVFIGISGAMLEPVDYDLGYGVRVSKTYAHLMAPFMVAYTPAPHGKHHPAPWSAASGGLAFDMHVQIEVSRTTLTGLSVDAEFVGWFITAILRLQLGPSFLAPLLGQQSFAAAKLDVSNAQFQLIEIEHRILKLDANPRRVITEVDLAWVAKHWLSASKLYLANERFRTLSKRLTNPCLRGIQIWRCFGFGAVWRLYFRPIKRN